MRLRCPVTVATATVNEHRLHKDGVGRRQQDESNHSDEDAPRRRVPLDRGTLSGLVNVGWITHHAYLVAAGRPRTLPSGSSSLIQNPTAPLSSRRLRGH